MPRGKGKRRASRFQKCIGNKLRGRDFPSRSAVRSAFKLAVKQCKGALGVA